MSGGTPIPVGADLNSDAYKVPGNYYCHGNNIAATLLNCPLNNAFILKVDRGTGTGYPRQIFYEYLNEKIIMRTYLEDINQWKEISLVTNNDLQGKSEIYAPYFDGNSYPTLALAVQACVDSLPNEQHKTYFRTVQKGSLYRAIIQKYISADYSSALVFSYDYDNPLTIYCKVGGAWQTPKKL